MDSVSYHSMLEVFLRCKAFFDGDDKAAWWELPSAEEYDVTGEDTANFNIVCGTRKMTFRRSTAIGGWNILVFNNNISLDNFFIIDDVNSYVKIENIIKAFVNE